jgi:hypothetical protein
MAVSDIILTPASVWVAPEAESPPATTVDYGAAWGGNWRNVGYTNVPLSMSFTVEKYEVMVEQSSLPVRTIKTKETAVFETQLVEITEANLLLAFPGATGTSTTAIETLDAGGSPTLDTYAWGFEGEYKNISNVSLPIRVFLYRGQAILNGQLQFAKGKEMGIPLQITGLADTGKPVGQQLFKIERHLIYT